VTGPPFRVCKWWAGRAIEEKRIVKRRDLLGLLIALPAAIVYFSFVILPLGSAVRYSFTRWDGIGEKTFVGLSNYVQIFQAPELVGSIRNSLTLIVFFSVIPIFFGLLLGNFIVKIRTKRIRSITQAVLFLPQIIPLAASGIAWSWMYAKDGLINQALTAIGLERFAQPWLAGFSTALPAVGLIGAWVLTGFCAVLLATGISKIDVSIYEAARIDGANWWQEFRHITIPGLRQEISVLLTVTTIAALSSFDIIYVTTLGGPGSATLVPGISIYRLAFTQSAVGLASAFGVVLMFIVLLIILPIQFYARRSD
jgi:raffinose/stachyose/melibiose transport system permease protein